jgi:hypothetical protein
MKKYLVTTGLGVVVWLSMALPVTAATIYFNPLGGSASYGNFSDTGLGSTNPTVVAAQIVNVFLQVLGLMCLLLMLYAGWRWVWAKGNTEDITQAKEILRGTIIGLIVILGSYGIMQWVFYYLTRITNAS